MATVEELRLELIKREAKRRGIDTNTVLERAPVAETAKSKFDELPPLAKLATAAADITRIGSNAVTLGGRDRFANLLGGGTPEEERAKTADAKERAGSAGFGAELLGMLLPGVGTSVGIGKAIPAIAGPRILPSLLRETAAGTTLGATQAALEEEPVGRGAVVGALGGLGGTVIGSTATKLLGKTPIARDYVDPRMTMDEQILDKDFKYEQLRKAGVQYDPADVGALSNKMRRDLFDAGADPELHAPALRRQKKFAQRNPVDLQDFDNQRQLISRDVSGPRGLDEMGSIMRRDIDEFIETVTPKTGTTAQAKNTIKAAREANRKVEVRRGVEEAIEKNKNAARETEGPFRTLLNKGTRGMSDEEIRLLKGVVRGEGLERALSDKLVDAGAKMGSVGAGATAGGLLAGPLGAGIGATGALALPPIARALSKKQRDRAVEDLLNELGGGKTIPSWLKKLLKNKQGAAGVASFNQYIDSRRER